MIWGRIIPNKPSTLRKNAKLLPDHLEMGFDGAASLTSKTGHGDMKKRGVHFQTASWKTWTNLEKLWKTMVFQPGKATNRYGKIHGFSHFPWNNGGKSSISPERWAASGWPRAFLAGGASTCQVGGLGPLVSCQTQREIRRKLCWRLLDGIFERRLNSTCQRILPRLRPSFLLLLPASSGDVAAAIKLSNCRSNSIGSASSSLVLVSGACRVK